MDNNNNNVVVVGCRSVSRRRIVSVIRTIIEIIIETSGRVDVNAVHPTGQRSFLLKQYCTSAAMDVIK